MGVRFISTSLFCFFTFSKSAPKDWRMEKGRRGRKKINFGVLSTRCRSCYKDKSFCLFISVWVSFFMLKESQERWFLFCAVVTNGFGKRLEVFSRNGRKKALVTCCLHFTSVDVLSRDVLSVAIIFLTRVFMFAEYRWILTPFVIDDDKNTLV